MALRSRTDSPRFKLDEEIVVAAGLVFKWMRTNALGGDKRFGTGHEKDMTTIMIDARYLNGRASGIGRYTEHLIEELLILDEGLKVRLVTHPNRPEPVRHERVVCETFGHEANSLSTRFLLSRAVDFEGVDLFHSPFNVLPAGLPVKAVFTLHDIMWLIDRGYCTDKYWKKAVTGTFYNAFIPRSVQEAAGVMTVSEHSRREIVRYFREIPDLEERMAVTYNGLDPYFSPQREEEAWPLLAKYLLPRSKFVLVVGQGSPYKNHEGAMRAFLEAFGEDPEVYLVFVRRLNGRADGELRRLMEDERVNSRVIQLDYVELEELRALYSMATAFLFPSLYEGFGLPALEAMACGTAVITSDRGAPAEVCGEGAIKVDPRSTQALSKALREVVYDERVRHGLEAKGMARAREFGWRECAEEALAFYYRMLE